jgi:nucleotide-binding universal stress UspA family protein
VFQKLLVPLDGTAPSTVALPLARTVAQATGAQIVLLRVIPEQHPDAVQRTETEQTLAPHAAELAAEGLHVESVVQPSAEPVPLEIVQATHRQGADLIVMATHGRGGPEPAVLGSVAERVVAESAVPVLLLRPGGHRVRHLTTLLVPVDGSPGSALALGTAVPLAQATGARIVLLQVILYLPKAYVRPRVIINRRWEETALESARSYVEGLARRLRESGITAEGRAVAGHAPDAAMDEQRGSVPGTIVDAANEVGADLIMMSTHALTGPERARLGSVAEEVVRTAPHPVLLVRRRYPRHQGFAMPAAACSDPRSATCQRGRAQQGKTTRTLHPAIKQARSPETERRPAE